MRICIFAGNFLSHPNYALDAFAHNAYIKPISRTLASKRAALKCSLKFYGDDSSPPKEVALGCEWAKFLAAKFCIQLGMSALRTQ